MVTRTTSTPLALPMVEVARPIPIPTPNSNIPPKTIHYLGVDPFICKFAGKNVRARDLDLHLIKYLM